MPIYEFTCKKCGTEYDELVPVSAKTNPPCPSCNSQEVERKISACASLGGSGSGPCGNSGFS